MLLSSHADRWMNCLFRLRSLPDPIIPLGQGMRGTGVMAPAAGGDWYSVYALLTNNSECCGLEQWQPLLLDDRKASRPSDLTSSRPWNATRDGLMLPKSKKKCSIQKLGCTNIGRFESSNKSINWDRITACPIYCDVTMFWLLWHNVISFCTRLKAAIGLS